MTPQISIHPLGTETWDDFVSLFGPRGACGGCWCMFWRVARKQFESQKGEGNKQAMKSLVERGETPGLLAYHRAKAIGWCSVGPRTGFPSLSRSRIFRRVDEQPCWSISCLFIAKTYRKQGVSIELLRAAVAHAKQQGAKIVEGYPVEPKSEKDFPPAFAWNGILSAFIAAGFTEVARRSTTRPLMRITLSQDCSREL